MLLTKTAVSVLNGRSIVEEIVKTPQDYKTMRQVCLLLNPYLFLVMYVLTGNCSGT